MTELSAVALAALERAPDVPAQAREELLALKSAATFVCMRPDGDIRPARASGEGLYADDTRHLSELVLTCGGLKPVLLSSAIESGQHAVINATNPLLRTRDGALVPQETLNVRRTVLLSDRLLYQVRIRNFSRVPAGTTVAATLAADFADVFEVRGVDRHTEGTLLAPELDAGSARFAYLAADGRRRETAVDLFPTPSEITTADKRVQVVWTPELAPRGSFSLLICVTPGDCGHGRSRHGRASERRRTASIDQSVAGATAAHEGWMATCVRVRTDKVVFDRLIDASLRDLHALMMPLGDRQLPAAGIPWYVAPFGRDSLLTAGETLMANPDIARGTLLALAEFQASDDEPWRDAEPGKILHELRTGELARTGRIPHTPYYGTADATPLFLMLAGAYYRWTLDLETISRLRPALDAALDWIDRWGDRDGDGFVEYERRSPGGLVNHGWKDSDDSVVHADGSVAQGPIALVEVQGYVYAAKVWIAEVYRALGDEARAERLADEAATLRAAFNEVFWMPDQQYFALALDGAKRQVQSITSNPAHCLFCGIVSDARAAAVAQRLMADDMFSGWGIRTLSSDSPAYNPMSYHNGSIWPHDNAIAAAGLRRYGFAAETAQIAAALFDAAADSHDLRLPELFCGFHRSDSRSIVPYPVACIPQAWAAAAPLLLLQAMLGISADAPHNRLTVEQPLLSMLERVELQGVRIGRSTVTLAFHRDGSSTAFSLLEQHGDVRVTMSA